MGYSCKIYFRKSYIKQNGNCAISLQIIINRKKKIIPLQLEWPPQFCEDSQNLCLPRTKDDPDVNDINIMLRDKISQANEIFKYHRLAGKELNMDRFLDLWNNRTGFIDFFEYFNKVSLEKFKSRKIEFSSYQRYKSTLAWLKRYKKKLQFSDFNQKWAHKFDNYLIQNIQHRGTDTMNTRWGYHKYVKCVLKQARELDQIQFIDPYQYFSIRQKKGNSKPLTIDQINQLYQYYTATTDLHEKRILRRFMFSIATGLSLAELYRIQPDWRQGDVITFVRKKNKRFNIPVQVPLSKMALKFWDEAIEEKGHRLLFNDYTHQYSNRVLKEIAEKIGIHINMHHHVARHTFTTIFLNNGGSLRAAQFILGHSSIKTTEKYDHKDLKMAEKERDKMEFINLDPPSHPEP